MTLVEFRSKVVQLHPVLKSFTHRFTSDLEEAQDLVQDTILKALMYGDKFRENTNLKGWLFTIMRNTFINNYRKSKVIRITHDDTREQSYLNIRDSDTFRQPDGSLEFKEIWRNVNAIPDDLLIPFKMHATGYKYEEISKQLKLPLGTIKNRIFHARKEIQKKLAGY